MRLPDVVKSRKQLHPQPFFRAESVARKTAAVAGALANVFERRLGRAAFIDQLDRHLKHPLIRQRRALGLSIAIARRRLGDYRISHFPLQSPPSNVTSVNLVKAKQFTGTLVGIKGQYLIFSDHKVMNVRGHEGVCVSLSVA